MNYNILVALFTKWLFKMALLMAVINSTDVVEVLALVLLLQGAVGQLR